MTTEQLRGAMHAAPFRPFLIRLADGRLIPVSHPGRVAHRPGARDAAVALDDGTIEVLDLADVALLVDDPDRLD